MKKNNLKQRLHFKQLFQTKLIIIFKISYKTFILKYKSSMVHSVDFIQNCLLSKLYLIPFLLKWQIFNLQKKLFVDLFSSQLSRIFLMLNCLPEPLKLLHYFFVVNAPKQSFLVQVPNSKIFLKHISTGSYSTVVCWL